MTEYEENEAIGEEAAIGTTEEDSEKLAQEIGKMVEKIEKEKSKIAEEEDEPVEYGTIIYRVEAPLLSAMLLQSKIYMEVLRGRLAIAQAAAIVEKELADITARLEQDLKRTSKTSRSKSKRSKSRSRKKSSSGKKSKSSS